jgi:Tol biopolymer transport system component
MRRTASYLASLLVLVIVAASVPLPATAQYFGRNKVQYDDFDFRFLETEHFQIYYYPEEEEAVRDAARMAERWYSRHARTYLREFREKKPVIFYANDADFHQTNVIGGFIGEGTGGVTEGLKQRVVMPLTGSYAETDHVLGHELVHSFQYDIAFSDRDTIRFNLGLLPLWMVEGTAEYLSVGRSDTHTAMWLRDAVRRDDLPTIDQLTRGQRYFPYRYGQAYMAYIGGKYGDAAVANFYKLAGRAGVDSALVYTLGIRADSLSREWQQVVRSTYEPLMEGRTAPEDAGRLVLAEDIDAGEINISPSVSPDGRYVAFLSERDLFTINLFVADAETGEVITSLRNPEADPHMDALRFINSAGSWSPDGRRLAFVSFAEGDNQISIFDVESRDVERNISVAGVSAMTNLSWSPDGASIAFSGLDGGISDLYVLNLESNAVRQLTNDRYADLQPDWSPDGRYLAFATDRGPDGTDFETLDFEESRLALYDMETNEIRVLRPFPNALHHNPQFSPDGLNLYFISDQDGFKDVYRLDLASEEPYRITNLATGISGITSMSPAMSVADQSGRMMFSVFADNEYTVYALDRTELEGTPVETRAPGYVATAGILPPIRALNEGLVGNYLNDPITGLPPAEDELTSREYSPSLQLDYVAPPTVGVSAGGPFGTQLGGGIGFFFSDMLGNRNLSLAVQAQGTLKDIGGQASYLDMGDRFNMGVVAGHIPLQFGTARQSVSLVEVLRQRIFIDQVSGIGQYPFSQTRRLEANVGFVRYGFDNEVEQYDPFGRGSRRIDTDDSEFFAGITEREPIYYFEGGLAYVGDYSFFGFTSPINGGRYRFEVSPQIGSSTYVRALADYRRYVYFSPLTFAARGMHIGNYGAGENDLFATQYLGYSYYPGFIRGYNYNSLQFSECTPGDTAGSICPESTRLQGTHIAISSLELRLPLLGTEQLGLFNFPYLPTELLAFADAGVAWSKDDPPTLTFARSSSERVPVVSTGLSARFNILGYIILESYYAYPFQRPDAGWQLGFRLAPGW